MRSLVVSPLRTDRLRSDRQTLSQRGKRGKRIIMGYHRRLSDLPLPFLVSFLSTFASVPGVTSHHYKAFTVSHLMSEKSVGWSGQSVGMEIDMIALLALSSFRTTGAGAWKVIRVELKRPWLISHLP